MPYYVPDSVDTYASDGAVNNIDVDPPAGYQDNDLWIVEFCQDVGTTAITAPGGWVQIATQAAVQGQRTTAFYKIISGSQTTANFTGHTDDWIVKTMLVRNADTSAPIDVAARVDSANSTSSTLTVTGVTTTVANTLVCFAVGWDNSQKIINGTVETSVTLTKMTGAGNCMITGYFNQPTAALTQNIEIYSEVSSEGGNAVIYAIKDVDPSNPQMSPSPLQGYEVLKRYGGITSAATNAAAFIRHDSITWIESSANIIPTTINSISVGTPTTWTEVATNSLSEPWGTFTAHRYQEAGGTPGSWFGYGHTITADLDDKIVSLEYSLSSTSTALVGAEGAIIYFDDGTNWAAFRLTQRAGILNATTYVSFIDVSNTTPYAASVGAIDWTAVTAVHFLIHKAGASTNSTELRLKNLLAHKPTIVVDGCAAAPVNSDFLRIFLGNEQSLLRGHGPYLVTTSANNVQSAVRTGFQIGNGSRKTYAALSPISHKLPSAYDTSFLNRFWQVPENSPAAEYRINLSASDTLSARYGAVYATPSEQDYVIASGSSTSATYDFSGQTIVGSKVTLSANITVNEAVLQNCEVIATTGTFDGIRFIENKNTIASSNPAGFENCRFTSKGTGHALEFDTPGTFAFEGNVFTGYGADTSTDAAIYNNSGGLITLQIPSGDATPTIRNGTGASTVIETPTENQKVTLTNLIIGSRVQIYDLTDDSELLNIVADATTEIWEDTNPYVADREIRVRVARQTTTTAKQFIEEIIGTLTSTDPQVIYRVNQVDDTVYNTNAVDGSTVTDITIDDSVLIAQIDTGTMSWQALYAYEMYWLTTATGIQDEGQMIEAVDEVNYLFDDLVITNVTDPEVALVMTGGYARNKTTGLTVDVFDLDGGSIFNAPDHVVGYAFGSGVTNQDKEDIINGVWDEALSGHTTSGTAGKIVKDGADSAELASIT